MEQRIIKVTLPYPLQSRGEERDREDAISFASRKSLNSRRQSQRRQQRQAAAAGNNRQALHPHTASMRSKRSVAGGPTPLGAKKYPQVCVLQETYSVRRRSSELGPSPVSPLTN